MDIWNIHGNASSIVSSSREELPCSIDRLASTAQTSLGPRELKNRIANTQQVWLGRFVFWFEFELRQLADRDAGANSQRSCRSASCLLIKCDVSSKIRAIEDSKHGKRSCACSLL